jgi:sortase B
MVADRADKTGRRVVKTVNSIINFAMLTAILFVVTIAVYALWDSEQVFLSAEAAQYEIYKAGVAGEDQSFANLHKINPEVIAWLTVYNTNIDYPIAQSSNNSKYINTDVMGKYSLSGSIFLDCNNKNDFSDFNSILYGHHMERQTMFGEIGLFSNKDYFDARLYGNLYYDSKDYGLEFFAFLHVDAYDHAVFAPGISDREGQQVYLDGLQEKANITRDIGVSVEDRIVLLSTCSQESTNGRDILVAKVTTEAFDNPFALNNADDTGIRGSANSWRNVPPWIWVILAVQLLFTGIVIYRKISKKKTLF